VRFSDLSGRWVIPDRTVSPNASIKRTEDHIPFLCNYGKLASTI